jgi:hypothetical protein
MSGGRGARLLVYEGMTPSPIEDRRLFGWLGRPLQSCRAPPCHGQDGSSSGDVEDQRKEVHRSAGQGRRKGGEHGAGRPPEGSYACGIRRDQGEESGDSCNDKSGGRQLAWGVEKRKLAVAGRASHSGEHEGAEETAGEASE